MKGDSYALLRELVDTEETVIRNNIEIISLLKQELEDFQKDKSNMETMKSYSQAVKKNKEEVLVVKPKNASQASVVTKQILEKNISPSSLGVGVSRVKYIREGGVAIRCGSQGDMENICKNVEEKLGHDYKVEIPVKKNPKIKVFNVDKTLLEDEENFKEKLVLQNKITTNPQEPEIKIVYKYETKKM